MKYLPQEEFSVLLEAVLMRNRHHPLKGLHADTNQKTKNWAIRRAASLMLPILITRAVKEYSLIITSARTVKEYSLIRTSVRKLARYFLPVSTCIQKVMVTLLTSKRKKSALNS